MGRGTEVKAKPADTLRDLDGAMFEFCVKDENSGELKMLHEMPSLVQHRGKWTQVCTPRLLSRVPSKFSGCRAHQVLSQCTCHRGYAVLACRTCDRGMAAPPDFYGFSGLLLFGVTH